jgi:type VI secretion system secreted protein VgrG
MPTTSPQKRDAKHETETDADTGVRAARLLVVDILDGGNDVVLTQDGIQYVNLPREERWVHGPVDNIDRLGGRLRINIRFDRAGAHRVWVRLRADAGNAVYSATELMKPGFGCDLSEREYHTAADGTLLIDQDFVLPQAGGNLFWLAARDEAGTQLASHRLTTRRLLYCQELVMREELAAPNLDNAVATLAARHVTLVPLPRVPLECRDNVDVENEEQHAWLLTAMTTAFANSAGAARAPYVFIVAYVVNLALMGKIKVHQEAVSVGPESPEVTVPVRFRDVEHYLWHGIDDAGWLAEVLFQDANGTTSKVTASAPTIAVANDHHYPDQCRKVRVTTAGISASRQTGRLTLAIRIVKKLLGGVSFGNESPLICLATRSGWTGISARKQSAVVLHEIGHKIGMVPDGTGKLDRLPLQYDGHGHVGSHCHHGVRADFSPFEIGRCLMFGEAVEPNQQFCDACADAVRKADLSGGWPP